MLQDVIQSERSVLQNERLLLQSERSVLQSERLLLHGFEAKQSYRRAYCSLQKVCNRERTPGSGRFLKGQFVRENAYFRMCIAPDTYVQGTKDGIEFEMKNGTLTGFQYMSGEVYVLSGGTADLTSVGGGESDIYGQLIVSSGGVVKNTRLENDGSLSINDGASATGTEIGSWGYLVVQRGGVADLTTVHSKGNIYVYDSGAASNTTVVCWA